MSKVPCKEMKASAYKALVRPHLEYAASVWDPPPLKDRKTKGLADKLEMVQRSSARWVFSSYRYGPNTTGPTEMISQLGWPLLTTRRYVSRLCLMFKMHRGMVRMQYSSLLVPHPYGLHVYHPFAFVSLDRTPSNFTTPIPFSPNSNTVEFPRYKPIPPCEGGG